ncbi:head-tail adaptor protein [Sinorhizobium sp. 7-81]|uniref:head-tail adaptor protein n=1 Tax=Sinorhizobium sp. 8-89 TaxID=3049089 RepID=UPI0024C3E051|nr:head-tail adaptor protein [Sinorhizobium sp. 8-89]MDK1489374.1 head-tail adaptor protein [Sinorhizobium sp. 8-89]
MTAGRMQSIFRFDNRSEVEDGFGNTVGNWIEVFRGAAEVTYLRGSETVMAARLTGKQPAILKIRSSEKSRSLTTDYRAVDARSGTEFAIRAVTPTSDRLYLEILVESGAPAA